MKTANFEVYEISNTFTKDFSLDKQISLGINDWQLDCTQSGHTYFGHTKIEAMENAEKGGY